MKLKGVIVPHERVLLSSQFSELSPLLPSQMQRKF